MKLSPSPADGADSGDLLTGLLRVVTTARPNADTQKITNAYDVASYWHQGQWRMNGDPYITHPVAVAAILAETGADESTVCAALLHDVVEDTPYTLMALRGAFGAEVAGLVDAVMALDTAPPGQVVVACTDIAAAVALAGDERALLIKVADRLHNMRTLRWIPRAKQVQKSRQVLEVVAPLARTLRMDAIGSELESLACTTLKRHGRRPGAASGRLLAATAALLPASARARWREEWLAELHVLSTRRERLFFAIQIMGGVGRLAVTLYQPAKAVKGACSAILAAVVTASGLVLSGWKTTVVIAAAVVAILTAMLWVLNSDDRTSRLVQLIRALRSISGTQPKR